MSAAPQQKPEIKIKLSVVKGPHKGQVFQLSKPSFTLGRGPENDVVLINDPQISRSHARISVVDRDLEVSNLSNKNMIWVQGESVQKWKIVNNSNFTIGDTEISVEYDLGSSVVSVSPLKVADVVPLKPKPQPAPIKPLVPAGKKPVSGVPQNRSAPPQARPQGGPAQNQMGMRPPARPGMPPMGNGQRPAMPRQGVYGQPKADSLFENPKFRFYLIAAIIIGALVFWLSDNGAAKRDKKVTSTLKYEDEINAKLASQKEKADLERREALAKERARSPQEFRVKESFNRAMRDFQLGNYSRAEEAFQVVLNLDPDHALAKRYLYLSKVRFDEIVQEKLMLGESNFKKHNYRMCEAFYRQVMDMLNGKSNDLKYMLASRKAKECELASEGIR